MRNVTAVLWLLAALPFVGLAPAAHAQATAADFADVGFTTVVTDAEDYPLFGSADILGLAIGEPGDGSLVFRFDAVNLADSPPGAGSEMDVFLTTPGGDYSLAVLSDGSSPDFDSNPCVTDGNTQYCSVLYDSIKVGVGDTISGISVVSYVGEVADYAPGDLFVDEAAMHATDSLPVGDPYVVQGSTLAGGNVTDLLLVTADNLHVDADQGGAAEYHLNITNQGNATAWAAGVIGLPADYASSVTPVTAELPANGSAVARVTVDIPSDAEPGAIIPFTVIVVSQHGFNTTLTLSFTVQEASVPPPTTSGSTHTTRVPPSTNTGTTFLTTVDNLDRTKTPGLELPLLAVCLVAVALFVRRRLSS